MEGRQPQAFHDISDRQERNIKRAFRQREALKRDARSWIEKTLGSDWHSLIERSLPEREAENAEARERNKPLTPEQIAQADAFLEQWGSFTKQPLDKAGEELQLLARRGYTVRDPGPSYSQQFVTNALSLDSTTRRFNRLRTGARSNWYWSETRRGAGRKYRAETAKAD